MSSGTLSLQCPTCKSTVEWNQDFPFRPFCSERCKMIDLGAWSSEEHVIPGETTVEAIEAVMDAVERGDIEGYE